MKIYDLKLRVRDHLNANLNIYVISFALLIFFCVWFYFTLWPIINLIEFIKFDINNDGKFSINDIGPLLKEFYFEPGYNLLTKFSETGIYKFFEFDKNNKITFVSGILSLILFIPIIVTSFFECENESNQSDIAFIKILISQISACVFIVFFTAFITGKI